jgi:hypothetical protein
VSITKDNSQVNINWHECCITLDKDQVNKSEISAYYSCYSKLLKDKLSAPLQSNAQLSGFCTMQESIVFVDTGTNAPIAKRQYPIPYKLHSFVESTVQDWLKSGVIQRADKPVQWNNPLLVVPKRNVKGEIKGWRLCIDPRAINSLIPSISFPLPLIRDLLESLKGSVIFSRLDLKSGYNQFLVNPEDRCKTAFTFGGTQYWFVGSPFGLKHLPAWFQRAMSTLFLDVPFVKVYMDLQIKYLSNQSELSLVKSNSNKRYI